MSNETRQAVIEQLNMAIRQNQNLTDAFDQFVADSMGINRTDYRCMDILERSGPMTAGQLAEAAHLSTGAVTALLDRVEAVRGVRHRPAPGGPGPAQSGERDDGGAHGPGEGLSSRRRRLGRFDSVAVSPGPPRRVHGAFTPRGQHGWRKARDGRVPKEGGRDATVVRSRGGPAGDPGRGGYRRGCVPRRVQPRADPQRPRPRGRGGSGVRPRVRVPVRIPVLPAVLHRAVPAHPGSLLAPPVGLRRGPRRGASPHGPLGPRIGRPGWVRGLAPATARRGNAGPVGLAATAGEQRVATTRQGRSARERGGGAVLPPPLPVVTLGKGTT